MLDNSNIWLRRRPKNVLIVRVQGAQHMYFSDLNTIVPFAGKALGVLGTINTSRQTKIMNSYIVSFFNKYLKGNNAPLLDQTTSNYAEVTIEKDKQMQNVWLGYISTTLQIYSGAVKVNTRQANRIAGAPYSNCPCFLWSK